MDLQMQDSNGEWVTAEGKTLNFVKAKGHENEAILWEPGCTCLLYTSKNVSNRRR